MKRAFLWAAVALALVVGLSPAFTPGAAPAQAQGNLLRDPSFEGPYVGRGRSDLNTPEAWGIWIADSPRNFDWQNRSDKVFAFPHPSDPERKSGSASLNLSGGYVTFTAAVFQQATVPANSDVTASVWGWLKTCNLPRNAAGELVGDNCGSAVESGAYVRVGIDPTGGTNPVSPSVVWSNNITPHDRWDQAAVSTRAQGTAVTVFAWVSQQWPADLNRVYFDDASLTLGIGAPVGTGGAGATLAPPTATPIPFASFVRAQPPQPDGSIVHTVQQGDTLAAIAFAYGLTLEEVRELNGLQGARWIFPGQEILIQAADDSESDSTPATTPIGTPAGTPSGGALPTQNGASGGVRPTATAQPFGGVIPTLPPRNP
jgi:hypothetical protein